jgi:hypothetical protein
MKSTNLKKMRPLTGLLVVLAGGLSFRRNFFAQSFKAQWIPIATLGKLI